MTPTTPLPPATSAPEQVAVARSHGPLGARYLSFTGAMGLSQLGDAAWYVALTWTLVREVGPATSGAVLALASLPRLVGLLGGGVLADRSGPRRVMVLTDVLRCAVMLVAALVTVLTSPTVPSLLVAAALLAFLSAFFVPASGVVRPLLLDDEHLVRGNALYVLGLRGGQAAGGPLGAWLIAVGGVPLVALANAVSYLVSAAASWRVRYLREPAAPKITAEPTPLRRQLLAQLLEGLRYLAREPRIRLVILVIGLTELSCAPPVNIGLVLLSSRLGGAAGGAGLLLTAYTVGAVASSLINMAWPPKRRAGLSLILGTLAATACLSGLGFAGSLPVGLGLYAVLGVVTGQFSVVLISMLQRWTDPGMRGRVMSVMSLVVFAAAPLSNLLVGLLIQALGLATAMCAFAVAALAAAAVICAAPPLRTARLD
ncbi:MFS transporter [Kitasatospora viridis]|uniref:Putative MFS family arabinose efflux permease n=1 Tax=Kitasatospora viridis TaxID=281105 RepID=A0A561UMV7_9ACTN|nr:MFS transporter [Kitasatospora viridis]TWG00706.1 putative MFS family arabinose efflux permease [Kitasatospora viridis]